MKYLSLIFMAVLFMTTSAGAVDTLIIHIWADTSGKLGDTDCVAGDCYLTLAAAEAAEQTDLVSADTAIMFVIKGGGWSEQAAMTIDGYTTDTTRNITIMTVGDARHGGSWDTDAWRISASGDNALTIADNHVKVHGAQVTVTGSSDYRIGIAITGTGCWLTNSIVWQQNSSASGTQCVDVNIAGMCTIYNCLIYGSLSRGIKTSCENDSYGRVINCTIADCAYGIGGDYKDGYSVNNIFVNCGDGIQYSTVGTAYNNATDSSDLDYGDCGTCGASDVYDISDPFTNAAGHIYTLSSGDVDVVDVGYNASAIVVGDIIGTSRPQGEVWDIGAYEYVAAAATTGRVIIIQ